MMIQVCVNKEDYDDLWGMADHRMTASYPGHIIFRPGHEDMKPSCD